MAQSTSTQTPGLWTSPNRLSAPQGSLRRAENVSIRAKDCVEPRRGYDLSYVDYTDVAPSTSRVMAGAELLPNTVMYPTKYYSMLDPLTLTGSTLVDYGAGLTVANTWSPPDASRMRMHFQAMLGRMYSTSSQGPTRHTGGSGTMKRAGIPCPEISYADSFLRPSAAVSVPVGCSIALRATFTTKFDDGRELTSAPSARVVLNNPSLSSIAIGAAVRVANVVTVTTSTAHGFKTGVTFQFAGGDPGLPNGWFTVTDVLTDFQFKFAYAGANVANTVVCNVQIGGASVESVILYTLFQDLHALPSTSTIVRLYRTESSAVGGVPGEDYYLIQERFLTAGEAGGISLTITDATPDSVLGVMAPFSASADTILKSKDIPPWCKTLAVIGDSGNRIAYANTREKHSAFIQVLSVGGASGLQLGDVITVSHTHAGYGTINQTATLVTNRTGGGHVQYYSGGSVSTDNQNVALGIVDSINASCASTSYRPMVKARYVSSIDDAPGQIVLEAMYEDNIPFTIDVTAARRNVFNPQFPITSTQMSHPSRVYFSEPDEPDAVPPLQYIDVGDPIEEIVRVIQLQDNTLVVKTGSCWILSGEFPNTRVQRLDATMKILGPDTVACVAGQVLALTNQGVVTISTSGVGVVGNPVEEDFEFLQYSSLQRMPYAIGYESEKSYVLAVPSDSLSLKCDRFYVYNVFLKTWTRWNVPSYCAWMSPSENALYIGVPEAKGVKSERKTFTKMDYVDEQVRYPHTNQPVVFVYNTTALTGTNVRMYASGMTGFRTDTDKISVGDTLILTPTGNGTSPITATVTAVDPQTHLVSLSCGTGAYGASGAAYCYKKYDTEVEWLPETAGDPSKAKQVKESVLHFAKLVGQGKGEVQSELGPAPIVSKTYTRDGFGMGAFGVAQYGDPSGPRNERFSFRWDSSRGAYPTMRLTTNTGLAYYKLTGKTLEFEQSSSTDKR